MRRLAAGYSLCTLLCLDSRRSDLHALRHQPELRHLLLAHCSTEQLPAKLPAPVDGTSLSMPGTGAGATDTVRKMTGPGGATLSYQVFQDAARTINWGNTTADEVSGTGTTTVTFYGQIPAGQVVAPGTYTDTLSTATTSFQVTAIVAASCTITANPLAFGNYAGLVLNSTTTILVTCSKSTTYNVGLNAGTSTGATVTNRSMTGPASTLLNYKLFRNSATDHQLGKYRWHGYSSGNRERRRTISHRLWPGSSRPIRPTRKLHRHDYGDSHLLVVVNLLTPVLKSLRVEFRISLLN